MTTARAKQLITNNVCIPTLPSVVQRVGELLEHTSGVREIGAVVADDPTLLARVLKVANSACYGLSEPCISTDQASSVLGERVLRNVVTQAAVISRFERNADHRRALDELWRHSTLSAHVASLLAHRSRADLGLAPDELHSCALLHDLGKIVMLENMGQEFLDVVRRVEAENLPACVIEEQRFGFNHADVGAMIAVQWGLPPAIVDAIQFHHGPRDAIEASRSTAIVAHANALVQSAASSDPRAASTVIDGAAMEFLGLSPEAVAEAAEFAAKSLVRTA
jgi:putative nucleotidyltransferase with HDIG domain